MSVNPLHTIIALFVQALGADVEYLIRRAQALERQQAKKDAKAGGQGDADGHASTRGKKSEHGATLEHLAQVHTQHLLRLCAEGEGRMIGVHHSLE